VLPRRFLEKTPERKGVRTRRLGWHRYCYSEWVDRKGGRIVKKKKAAKPKKARGMRNLPAKTLNAKQARDVKGGLNREGSLDAGIIWKLPPTR
jgi:hypothetical protein